MPRSRTLRALAVPVLLAALAASATPASADWTVAACAPAASVQAGVTLTDYPPGSVFIGIYAGTGASIVHTNSGSLQSACASGSAAPGP